MRVDMKALRRPTYLLLPLFPLHKLEGHTFHGYPCKRYGSTYMLPNVLICLVRVKHGLKPSTDKIRNFSKSRWTISWNRTIIRQLSASSWMRIFQAYYGSNTLLLSYECVDSVIRQNRTEVFCREVLPVLQVGMTLFTFFARYHYWQFFLGYFWPSQGRVSNLWGT